MITSFKIRFRRLFKWSLGLFFVLFVFRIIYGYVSPEATRSLENGDSFFNSLENVRKNYASEKVKIYNNELLPEAKQTIISQIEIEKLRARIDTYNSILTTPEKKRRYIKEASEYVVERIADLTEKLKELEG